MDISIENLKDFALRRLEEERSKERNAYTRLVDGNVFGVHYWDFIKDYLENCLFSDLQYAIDHPDCLKLTISKSLSDYATVGEALNNIHTIYKDSYVESIVVIVANANIVPIYYKVNIATNEHFTTYLKRQVEKRCDKPSKIDWWLTCNSYNIFFREQLHEITIVIHSDNIPNLEEG